MKITDRFKRKEIAYRYIEAGTVFKLEGNYYMATTEIVEDDVVNNCVNLNNGELRGFDECEMVEPLEAELIVK